MINIIYHMYVCLVLDNEKSEKKKTISSASLVFFCSTKKANDMSTVAFFLKRSKTL